MASPRACLAIHSSRIRFAARFSSRIGVMKRPLGLMIALSVRTVLADTPLPSPERLEVCSANKIVCAVSDPVANETVASSAKSREVLWTLPGWHRWLFVSDDGMSVVVGYSGMNLVPVEVTLEEPVLFFYRRGKLIRSTRLGDLYKHISQLPRTASHLAWANGGEFNDSNQFVVTLAYGRRVAFSPDTGQVVREIRDDF